MGQPADTCSIWKLQPQLPHVKRMQRRLRRRQCSRSNSGIAFGHESRMDDELRTSLWQIRREPRSGSRPGQGVNNASRVTHGEQKTLPVETLVRSRLLSMTLKQLELRCTSNTVHFVLNEENSKDALLNSNEVWQLLGRTPRFIPTLKRVDVADIARDCDIFGYRLIKAFNRFACRKYIQHAKNHSIEGDSKQAYYHGSLISFRITLTSMHNTPEIFQRHKTLGIYLEDALYTMSEIAGVHCKL